MKTRFLLLVFVVLLVSSGIAMACDMMEDEHNRNEINVESNDIDNGMMAGRAYEMMGIGMMGYGYQIFNVFSALYLILLIGLIILIYVWIIKLWKEMK